MWYLRWFDVPRDALERNSLEHLLLDIYPIKHSIDKVLNFEDNCDIQNTVRLGST